MVVIPAKKVAFLHIPKCGGNWVRKAFGSLNAAGCEPKVRYLIDADAHSSSETAVTCHGASRLFAFVRHPVGWYESFWRHRQQRRNNGDGVFDKCMDADFNEFAQRTCESFPGALSKFYFSFVDHPAVVSIGRTHSIAQDFLAIIEYRLGYVVKNADTILKIKPQNASVYPKPETLPSTELMIENSERKILDRFF